MMRLRNHLGIWSIGMAALVLAPSMGCVDSVTGGGSGGTGGQGGDGGKSLIPPCADGTVLAMDQLFFGDTDPDLTPNPTNGWKQYGRNIDTLVSTKDSIDLCQPTAGGAAAAVYPDGNEGIDNSFGKNVLPILLGLDFNGATTTNASLQKGEFTYLLTIRGQNEPMSCPLSALFGGRTLGATPKFDGTDQWPLDPALFVDPTDPASVKNVFPDTTIENDVYRSGPEAEFTLEMHFSVGVLYIPIRHARFEMKLESGQTGAIAGQLSGIIDAEALAQEIGRLVGAFDASLCDPNSPTYISIVTQIRQAADILSDGTQDPTKECNAISLGIGFTMKSAKLGAIGPAASPPSDACKP
jgi:hypothetical protein